MPIRYVGGPYHIIKRDSNNKTIDFRWYLEMFDDPSLC